MTALSQQEIAVFLLGLGILLGAARLLGELALRYHQPAVLGELFAGILLGPTVMGRITPEWSQFLFPAEGGLAVAFNGLTTLAITLFLMVAGMEVDLSTIWRQGKAAVSIGVMGIILPFALGFVAAWYAPGAMGADADANLLLFSLFFATALSISALPVIAKTLMDLNLFRTDLGMIVMAAAIFNDLVGWIIFAVILSMMGSAVANNGMPISYSIGLTLGFVVIMLTVVRWLINRLLPWIQAHASWPGGVLGWALSCTLLCAAFTEWIGVHAIFGAFLFGVALGDSQHLRERTRATIDQFVSFIFAPLFFASIGLHVNFIEGFDTVLVITVLLVATVGKLVGCGLGAKLGGLSPREALAAGFAMNSRGVMEIILGLLALQVGLIRERLFIALVVMALVTSMMSGTLIQMSLKQRKPRRFTDYLTSRATFRKLKATQRRAAISELVAAACEEHALDQDQVDRLVWSREQIAGTSLAHGVAVPHARLDAIDQPVVVVGISEKGIDWDSADGEPAWVVVLLLTPKADAASHLDLLSDVARTFRKQKYVQKAREMTNYTEFLAFIKSDLQPKSPQP